MTDKVSNGKKTTIIATKGSLDWAYPPFIIASTAAALDREVVIFFTFYGLSLLLKNLDHLKVSPMGNPAMPMKMPIAPIEHINLAPYIPNFFWSIPGSELLATYLMKKTMAKKGVAKVEDLRAACVEMGVKMIACEMTVDLFGYDKNDFIDGIEFAGAAYYVDESATAQNTLFI